MRGTTMILVVYSHVCNYCLGDQSMGLNDIFFLFRMPCFFFISGFLFYKAASWTRQTVRLTVKKKILTQIVPTFIFLLLLAPPPLFFSQLGATKGGYWFTFALFEFILIYMLSTLLLQKCRWGTWAALAVACIISIAAFSYDIYYHRLLSGHSWASLCSLPLGFLSFMTWRYYLFFFIGTVARRHADRFVCLLRSRSLLAVLLLIFALAAFCPKSTSVAEYTRFAFGGISGMALVFSFFRHFSEWFSRMHLLGRSLQLVGCRTLDIYLLHYFFLPRFLIGSADKFRSHPLIEIAEVLAIAVTVTAICLVVSSWLRKSPLLARYLFGVKTK